MSYPVISLNFDGWYLQALGLIFWAMAGANIYCVVLVFFVLRVIPLLYLELYLISSEAAQSSS